MGQLGHRGRFVYKSTARATPRVTNPELLTWWTTAQLGRGGPAALATAAASDDINALSTRHPAPTARAHRLSAGVGDLGYYHLCPVCPRPLLQQAWAGSALGGTSITGSDRSAHSGPRFAEVSWWTIPAGSAYDGRAGIIAAQRRPRARTAAVRRRVCTTRADDHRGRCLPVQDADRRPWATIACRPVAPGRATQRRRPRGRQLEQRRPW